MVQERLSGNASEKQNCWYRGHGPDSMRRELKRGLSLNRKTLNRKVRHQGKDALQHGVVLCQEKVQVKSELFLHIPFFSSC